MNTSDFEKATHILSFFTIFGIILFKIQIQTIFNAMLVFTFVFFPFFGIFFYLTGDEFLINHPEYTEDICIAGKDSWHVNNCTIWEQNITSHDYPRMCYYNRDCKILFKEPKIPPLWFYIIFIVDVIVLICSSPLSPYWKCKKNYNFRFSFYFLKKLFHKEMEEINKLIMLNNLKNIHKERHFIEYQFNDDTVIKFKNNKISLKTDYLNNYKDFLQYIDKLVLSHIFNEDLMELPENIKKVKIGSCDFNYSIKNLPQNLEKLDFSFYSLLTNPFMNLPANIKVLRIIALNLCNIENERDNYNFNYLPSNLKTFEYMGHLPKSGYYFDNLPDSLVALKVQTNRENESFDFLPAGLKFLCIRGLFNSELNNLPSSLEILDIRCIKYDKIIKCLPQSIKMIIVKSSTGEFYDGMVNLYGNKVKTIKDIDTKWFRKFIYKTKKTFTESENTICSPHYYSICKKYDIRVRIDNERRCIV